MRNLKEYNNLWHLATYTNLRPTYTAQRGRVNRQARAHASTCETPSARKAFSLFVPVISQRAHEGVRRRTSPTDQPAAWSIAEQSSTSDVGSVLSSHGRARPDRGCFAWDGGA